MSRRRFRRAALTLVGALVLVAAVAVPAGAHSATGTMGIEVTPGTEPLTLKVRILLEYANDREVAPGATVTATATGPDGATAGPVPLADRGQGSYEGVVTVPAAGAWTVTVSSADPAATATASATVAATSATTGDLVATATTAASGDIETSSDRATQDERRDDGGGTSPALIAAIAVVIAAAIGVVVVLVRNRRRTP